MRAIKLMAIPAVFVVVFFLSLAVLSGFFNEKFYYKTSARLFQHQDDLENSLIVDLQKMIEIINSHSVENSIGNVGVCDPES